jgi:hypothetical protein
MQWRPFLPKEVGLIQVDIGGHPPFPTHSKLFFGNFGNLLFLAVLTFGAILRAQMKVFWDQASLPDISMDKFLTFCGNVSEDARNI